MTQEIAVPQERHPLLRVSESTLVARQLQSYIREARLSVRVGQSEHVRIEGWQFLCLVLGVPFPSIIEVRRSVDEQGNIVYSACAELCLPNSPTPHRAWALCSTQEPNWRGNILRERMTPDEARELLREYYGVSRVSDLNDEQRAHLYRTLTEGGER